MADDTDDVMWVRLVAELEIATGKVGNGLSRLEAEHVADHLRRFFTFADPARCRLLEAERDKALSELTQRRQLLTEWMDWWEQDDDAPPKLPMALHVRTALTLATPDVIEVAARGGSVPETP